MPRGWSHVPEEVTAKITSLRNRGHGPDRIYQELETELKGLAIGPRKLSNYVYRDGDQASSGQAADKIGKVADLLERSGIDPADVGAVKSIKLSEWQGLTKNDEGEAELHDLEGASVVLSPKWAEGPAWTPIDRGPALKLPRPPQPRKVTADWMRAVVIPDVQIGFRRDLDTAELDPFHDELAMAAALRVVRDVDPDLIVVLGDLNDFAPFGRFEQEPGFALTTQPGIDRSTLFLAELRVAAPRARIVVIEGNHDRRLAKQIVANAVAAFGLRPGFTPPDTWPDLSIPHLLRFEELGVEYVGGYPAGLFWINERLACIHGHRVNSAGSTAARVVDDSRISLIFGHVHRMELQHRTRLAYEGAKFSLAATPGCLCRIDGTVPSTKSAPDAFGRPVPTVENWSHGVAVVTYKPGDGPFGVELVPIFDGNVLFRGRDLVAA